MTIQVSLKKHLRQLRSCGGIEVHERVDLRAWSGFRIGGIADILIRCRAAEGVQDVLDLLASHGSGWFVLGAGTGSVLPDNGLRVPVLTLGGDLCRWELDAEGVTAGAGGSVMQVGRAAARAGLSGFQGLIGTVGSVGGAMVTALDDVVADAVHMAKWLDTTTPGGTGPRRMRSASCDLVKQWQALPRDRGVLTGVRWDIGATSVAVNTGDEGAAGAAGWRRSPGLATAVFKDPEGAVATHLLEEAGCLGLTVGGARVDENHANTILTARAATAVDVVGLCERMRQLVFNTHGVELVTRIRFIDEYGGRFDP